MTSKPAKPEIIPRRLYKHYKGGVYYLLSTGKLKGSGELYCIYRSAFDETDIPQIRPAKEWNEVVENEKKEKVYRYIAFPNPIKK